MNLFFGYNMIILNVMIMFKYFMKIVVFKILIFLGKEKSDQLDISVEIK